MEGASVEGLFPGSSFPCRVDRSRESVALGTVRVRPKPPWKGGSSELLQPKSRLAPASPRAEGGTGVAGTGRAPS